MRCLKHKLMKGLALFLAFSILMGIPLTVKASYDPNNNNAVVSVQIHVKGLQTFWVWGDTGEVVKTKSGDAYQSVYVGDTLLGRGSGFFVGADNTLPQYIVTNCHVVEDYISSNEGGSGKTTSGKTMAIDGITCYQYYTWSSCEVRIYYDENDYDEAFVVDYGAADFKGGTIKKDLAILKLRKPTNKRHALRLYVPTQEDIGKTIYTVGFPGNSENELTGASKWSNEDVVVSTGAINKLSAASGTGVETIQVDANILKGNSGGPLIDDEHNAVIGINTWSYSPDNQTQTNYSINVSELIEMLDKNNVPYEMAKTKGKFNPLFVIIPAAVVIVAVVVIIIAVNAKKGKNKKQIVGYDPTTGKPIYAAPQPQPQAPAQPQYQQPQAPAQPQYQQPQAPVQPQYQQPQYQPPVQPQYQQPQATPAQQLYPGQPQYQPPVQPQYQQPQAPNGQQYQPPQQ